MVNVSVFDVPPPEALNTVTLAVPAVAMSAALMLAVNWVLDTNVVGRFVPSQRTVASAIKPVPFTVRVKAGPPAVADEGLKLVMLGAAGLESAGLGLVATNSTAKTTNVSHRCLFIALSPLSL